MYDYLIVNKITKLMPDSFIDLNNDAINVGINDNLRELALQHNDELKDGWEIVSHNIVFYQGNQLISLLLRRESQKL